MKIASVEKISPYIFGAIRIYEENDWICFSRYTQVQDIWLDNNDFSRDRFSTSGMRLEFTTHGGRLSFDYEATKGSNGDSLILGIEIVADGIPVYHFYKEESSCENKISYADKISYEIMPSDKSVHICVYFPLRASLKLKNLIIPEDAQIVNKKTKLLAYGDSITAGAVCQHSNHSYVNILADHLNAELVNQGVGGMRYSSEFLDKLPYEPDIITVAYGVNDYSSGTLFDEEPQKFLEKIYNMYANKKVLVLLPIWCGKETDQIINGHTLEEGRKHIQDIANKYSFNVIDCKNFVPHLSEFYWDDINLHPNDLGSLYYGHNLLKKLEEIL